MSGNPGYPQAGAPPLADHLRADRNLAWAAILVDELARCGVRHAVLSPGSRSAPLALAVSRHPRIQLHVVLDERSAAYFALGMAKVTGTPAVVVTTSGTAVANLLPAAIEADSSATPLLLVTADRPPELVDVGANQAIRQPGIFGTSVRWMCSLPVPDDRPETLRYLRQSACRAFAFARTGPVHVNVPFREHLAPRSAEAAEGRPNGHHALADSLADSGADRLASTGRSDGTPFVDIAPARRVALQRMGPPVGPRGLVVLGPGAGPMGHAAIRLALKAGVPVVADALSGQRGGGDLAGAEAMLHSARLRGAMRPDWILHVGASPTSRSVRAYLAEHVDVPRIVVDPRGRAWDDVHGASHILPDLPDLPDWELPQAEPEWRTRWQEASTASLAVPVQGTDWEGPVAQILMAQDAAFVWAGSSLPVRDLDRFMAKRGPAIVANRGASGIDGVLSSAAGAACAKADEARRAGKEPPRCLAYVGDLTFLHDVGALAAIKRHAANLVVVVLNNGGGRIFEHLPIAESIPRAEFEALFATPQDVDIGRAAAAFGLPHVRLHGTGGLAKALQASAAGTIVEVVVDGRVAASERKRHLADVVAAMDRLVDSWERPSQPARLAPGQEVGA